MLFSAALISCVSKKKFVRTQKAAAEKEVVFTAEKARLQFLNDSLKQALVFRDSVIDSLSFRLNELTSKKEKEKSKTTGVSSAKKSTLTKDQEYEKKSLFLYNFTKLIEWPIEYNGTEFVIGVVGDEQWIKQLQGFMAQKKVSGKKIIVEKYKKGARYNVVYIPSSEMSAFAGVKAAIKKSKTLLVTDDAAQGTHISFMLDQDKVRYLVDKVAIEKAGMKVGQELMRYSG
jgi:hypothetical protein